MRLKDGVDPRGVHTKIWEALWMIEVIYDEQGEELVVTSLRDGKHKERSEHYKGNAADIRTRIFNKAIKKIVFETIKKVLGKDYIVFWHNTHFHIHWAPIA